MSEQTQKGVKSRVIFYIFSTIIIVLLALLLLTVVITKQSGSPIMLMNHGLMLVDGDKMGLTIPKQSVIVIKYTPVEILKEGDVITVRDYDEIGIASSITTRIVRSNATESGLTFITKGDINDIDDQRLRTENDIYGRVIMVMPIFGKSLTFVKSPLGLGICVALPLALLLLLEIINLFRASRMAEQEDEYDSPEMFGTRSGANKAGRIGVGSDRARMDVPLDVEHVKRNLSDKVRALKVNDSLATPLYNTVQMPVITENTSEDEFTPLQTMQSIHNLGKAPIVPEPPDLPDLADFVELSDEATVRIYTKDEEDAQDALDFTKKRTYKIEPLNESRVRITPHKIITRAEEEAETFSDRILTLRDELMQDAEILENMGVGEYEFDRPTELMFGTGDNMQNSSRFSKNSGKLALKRDERTEFTATVQRGGRDHFSIEGIDVRVRPNALRLNLEDDLNGRDVTITVTDEYTNVVVDGTEYQVNFALFKDVEDGEQKTVIQKTNK